MKVRCNCSEWQESTPICNLLLSEFLWLLLWFPCFLPFHQMDHHSQMDECVYYLWLNLKWKLSQPSFTEAGQSLITYFLYKINRKKLTPMSGERQLDKAKREKGTSRESNAPIRKASVKASAWWLLHCLATALFSSGFIIPFYHFWMSLTVFCKRSLH